MLVRFGLCELSAAGFLFLLCPTSGCVQLDDHGRMLCMIDSLSCSLGSHSVSAQTRSSIATAVLRLWQYRHPKRPIHHQSVDLCSTANMQSFSLARGLSEYCPGSIVRLMKLHLGTDQTLYRGRLSLLEGDDAV